MRRRICIASSKGGVGKTTTGLNLAVSLAELGHQVLLVDLDPQGGIGHSLAKKDSQLTGLADILFRRLSVPTVPMATKLPNLYLLPRGVLNSFEIPDYERELSVPGKLKDLLDTIIGEESITIIDTPSGLGPLTRTALGLSDWLLVLFQTEILALRSVTQILKLANHIRTIENRKLRLLGILPCMVEKQKNASLDILETIWTNLSGVLDTVIPRHEVFSIASRKGLPISFLPGPISPEAVRFSMLATEVLAVMDRDARKGSGDENRLARTLI